MAAVYLAIDNRLERRVALKVLSVDLGDDERFRDRFIRESHLAASLDHPNITPIYEAGEFEGSLFIAMRYVNGVDLRALIKEGRPIPPARAIAIVSQVGSALDAAHARNLVHRDVKPANILLYTPEGADSQEHVYLSDFGLAKSSTSNTGLTQTGQFMGTLDYVAPEQIEGKSIDARADIYALGCVLYECLVGSPPFDRDSSASLMYAHLQEPPPRASVARPGLPVGLDDVIAKAMAKSPDDRYASASDMVRDARRSMVSTSGGENTAITQQAPIVATVLGAAPPLVPAAPLPAEPEADAAPAAPLPRPVSGAATWREAPILVPDSQTGAYQRRARKGTVNNKRRAAVIGGVVAAVLLAGSGVVLLSRPSSVASKPPSKTAATAAPTSSGQATAAPTPSGPLPISSLTAQGLPQNHQYASLGFDPVSQRLILVGGNDGSGNESAQTWAWDGKTWTEVSTSGVALSHTAMVLDPNTNRLVLLGGDAGGPSFWTWDGQNWSEVSSSNPPAELFSPAAAAFPAAKQIVITSDQTDQQQQQQGQGASTSYVWNGSTWSTNGNSSNYDLTAYSTSSYDPQSKRIINLDSGSAQQGAPPTYAWNGASWSQLTTTASPPSGGATSATDEGAGNIVLLAGSVNNPSLPTTWLWDGSDWNRKIVDEPPLGIYALAWDPAVAAVVLVVTDHNNQTTMWVWNAGEWSQIPA
jgi:serine/threonine-protein kinase